MTSRTPSTTTTGRTPSTTSSYPSGTGRTFGTGGSNFHAPQGSTVRASANGGKTYTHNGTNYTTNSQGHLTGISKPGMQARFASSGRVSQMNVTRPGGVQMTSSRPMRGGRTVVSVRPDHTRVVSYGSHNGYLERPVGTRGYVQRTYVYGGRTSVYVYRSYSYRGFGFYDYVPPVYFGVGFYGWAWNPWPAPIAYRWGWFGRPWFGFYGGYFAPAPFYPTAALWLTDYLIAANLQRAYDAQQAAAAEYGRDAPPPDVAQPRGAMLSPEVRQAIAEEVRQQIAAERAASQSGYSGGAPVAPTSGQAPGALDPKQRIFVVSTSMDVSTDAGQNCALTGGDILLRTSDSIMSDGRVAVSVLSSKQGDCPINSGTAVDVAALQEMHNEFRQQIDSGMQQLASNQGQGGLPPGPPASPHAVAVAQAKPDAAVDNLLTQQQQDAKQAEAEVQQAANGAN